MLTFVIAVVLVMADRAAPVRNDSVTLQVVARNEKPLNVTKPIRVRLKANGAKPLPSRVDTLARGRRLFLVIGGLHADRGPGATFDVFLDLPANASAAQRVRHFAGNINFYSAVIGETGRADAHFSFDITDVARALRRRGLLCDATTLTIVPDGPAAGKPFVDWIEIVEE